MFVCLVFCIFATLGACRVLGPQLGIEKPHPLNWKLRVLTSGPPGKSPYKSLLFFFFFSFLFKLYFLEDCFSLSSKYFIEFFISIIFLFPKTMLCSLNALAKQQASCACFLFWPSSSENNDCFLLLLDISLSLMFSVLLWLVGWLIFFGLSHVCGFPQ